MEDTQYICVECDKPVYIHESQCDITRSCEHHESGIIAEISAVAYGQSSLT